MTQKKSILFLTKLYHPHIGGVETHLEQVSKILINRGYKVTILTEKYGKGLIHKETVEKINVVRIPIPKNEWMKKFYIWKWIILNWRFFLKFDFIHVHDVFYWLYPIFPVCFTKKVYTTFHGYEGYPIKWRWILHRKVAEILSQGSICVGEFMKKRYFASPTYVIYGGARLKGKSNITSGLSAVFFGRLDEQTGILEYLEAYKIIKKVYPRFKMTIIGEGALRSKIPKDVKVLGFKENVESYIASNRFIFVSRYLSMIEALLQKKEVIAVFDNPVKEDYLKMSPFKKYVYVGKNSTEIAQFVTESIKKGADEAKIDKGYKWAKNQTWENIVKTYTSLWN